MEVLLPPTAGESSRLRGAWRRHRVAVWPGLLLLAALAITPIGPQMGAAAAAIAMRSFSGVLVVAVSAPPITVRAPTAGMPDAGPYVPAGDPVALGVIAGARGFVRPAAETGGDGPPSTGDGTPPEAFPHLPDLLPDGLDPLGDAPDAPVLDELAALAGLLVSPLPGLVSTALPPVTAIVPVVPVREIVAGVAPSVVALAEPLTEVVEQTPVVALDLVAGLVPADFEVAALPGPVAVAGLAPQPDLDAGAGALDGGLASVEDGLAGLGDDLGDLGDGLGDLGDDLGDLGDGLGDLGDDLDALGDDLLDLGDDLGGLDDILDGGLDDVTGGLDDVTGGLDDILDGGLEDVTGGLDDTLDGVGEGLDGLL